jgi:uncharacterized membrane protein YciS (DUF1049 family)
MFRWFILVACLLAAVTGLIVGVMNPDPVPFHLPGLSVTIALGSLLVMAFIVGLAIGLLIFLLLFHLPSRLARAHRRSATSESRLPDRHA